LSGCHASAITARMKVNVEFDCTPEEARRLMGLPDLTPVHDAFMRQMLDAVSGTGLSGGGMSNERVEAMMKSWLPLGDAGMRLWGSVFDGAKQAPPAK